MLWLSIAVLLLLALFAPWSYDLRGLVQSAICLVFVFIGINGVPARFSDPDGSIYFCGAIGWGFGFAVILLLPKLVDVMTEYRRRMRANLKKGA
jgi:hypothetical protein